jgi:hypothetical protein
LWLELGFASTFALQECHVRYSSITIRVPQIFTAGVLYFSSCIVSVGFSNGLCSRDVSMSEPLGPAR